jgi:hypothetical protein
VCYSLHYEKFFSSGNQRLADMGAGFDIAKDMIKKIDSPKDRKRAEVQQAFENRELTQDMVDHAKSVLGEDATEE